ncbi:ComF family protein [Terasakiella sp. A23]|uniref:ComF family protein n=1 Tax=Terasakiella sp. FCG-A23 TaxID=3080561 RepID=UPI0029542C17|nr:ComF family protein [Terasakiella sp. A23]MDV7340070.1 ComF family protein [Terasakiella sp. A23]
MTPFAQVLDLFLPPRCIACAKPVSSHKTLCADCWEDATFVTAPYCSCCGLPFEYEVPDTSLCLDCARCAPPFKQARTVFPYDEFSKKMILSFKHGDRCDLAPALAGWMVRAAPDLIKTCDVITPVPLHWRRLIKRKYNQAGLLAREIAKQTNLPCDQRLLKRIRHTPPQGHLSRMARQKNLKGAFACTKQITGQSVLLIDDVMTTGATLLNCTDILLDAGAKEVHIITLARVAHTQTQ